MNVIYERMTGVEITRSMAVKRLATGDGNVWLRLSDADQLVPDRVLISAGTEGERTLVQITSAGTGYESWRFAMRHGQLLVEAGALARDAERAAVSA